MSIIYASSVMMLNSNIDSGGGTDITAILNSTLAGLNPGDTLILDGYGLISGTIFWQEVANFQGTGVGSSGLYLANFSDCCMLMNANVSGTVMTAGTAVNGNFTLNGNEANQHKFEQNNSLNEFVIGIWSGGCSGIHWLPTVIRNAKTFGSMWCFVNNITCDSFRFQWDNPNLTRTFINNWDGLHFWGDCSGFTCNNFWHNGDDDAIGLNTNEGVFNQVPVFLPQRAPITSTGNLLNFSFSNVWLDNSNSGLRISAVTGSTPHVSASFTNVRGSTLIHQTIFNDQLGTAVVDTLSINGWSVFGPAGIVFTGVGNLTMNDIMAGTPVTATGTTTSGNYFTTGEVVALVAQFGFENLNDSVGRYNLTNVGGATIVSGGKFGNCVSLNGSSQYLTNQALAGTLSNECTVNGWINYSGTPSYVLFSSFGSSNSSYADNVRAQIFIASNTTAEIVNNSTTDFQVSNTLPPASSWHMITYQISAAGGFVRLKVDNNSWQSTSWTGTLLDSGVPFCFGVNLGAAGNQPTSFLNGKLDQFRIYGGILPDSAITALFNEVISNSAILPCFLGRLGMFSGILSSVAVAVSLYFRPDGTSKYLRPDGTSLYQRP